MRLSRQNEHCWLNEANDRQDWRQCPRLSFAPSALSRLWLGGWMDRRSTELKALWIFPEGSRPAPQACRHWLEAWRALLQAFGIFRECSSSKLRMPSILVNLCGSELKRPSYFLHRSSFDLNRWSNMVRHSRSELKRPSYFLHHSRSELKCWSNLVHRSSSDLNRWSNLVRHSRSELKRPSYFLHRSSSELNWRAYLVQHSSFLLKWLSYFLQ